jgi:hypothetical protein
MFGVAKTSRVGLVALIERFSCDMERDAGAGTWGLQKEGDRKTSTTGGLVYTTYFDSPFLALLAVAARSKV